MGWLSSRLRSGRYSMNLQLLQADIVGTPIQYRAAVILEAAVMLVKLRTDDFMMGTLLQRLAFESMTGPQEAENLYNALEDVLNAQEAQRKQILKHAADRLGADAAIALEHRARIQQEGLRLLLVALARKVDDDFKVKARALREPLYEARGSVEQALSNLQQEDRITGGLGLPGQDRDYERIGVQASLIAMSFLGW